MSPLRARIESRPDIDNPNPGREFIRRPGFSFPSLQPIPYTKSPDPCTASIFFPTPYTKPSISCTASVIFPTPYTKLPNPCTTSPHRHARPDRASHPVHQTARSVYGIFQTAQSQQAQSGRNSPSGCAAQPALCGRPAYSPTALPHNTKSSLLAYLQAAVLEDRVLRKLNNYSTRGNNSSSTLISRPRVRRRH